MSTHGYQDLEVWKRAVDLTVSIYEACNKLPNTELYAIADQMKRAAVSIPSNIAEGQKRFGARDTLQFCNIALGSLAELETQLIIVKKVYKIDIDKILYECEIISRMLHALTKSLRAKNDS